VNEEFYNSAISVLESHPRVQSGLWPDQSTVPTIQPIVPGVTQMPSDSYHDWFSGAAAVKPLATKIESDLPFRELSPSWPTQPTNLQRRSGTLQLLIDPYTSAQTQFASALAGESQNLTWTVPWNGLIPITGAKPNIQEIQQQASLSVAENWEKQDDLRFDLLVEKEALGELSLEEAKELEQLSDKHDRTLAGVSEEDLLRERMRGRALTELRDLLEKYAPLFARRR
jgi:hypothetical protein